jgi:5'-nucleotidase
VRCTNPVIKGGVVLSSVETVVIIHTNDLHSHFHPMPRVASTIQSIRDRQQHNLCITADIGDHIDRMRMETEGTDGLANRAVMNYCHYDVVVPGNNEGLTLDKHKLEVIYGPDNVYKAICCNMVEYDNREPVSWIQPYRVIGNERIKVGLIGVTADFNDFYHELGWHLLPPIEAVAAVVKQVRQEVDIVVICSHLGLSRDKELAEKVEGIDCVLGGHTHHFLSEPLVVNGTLICATGKFGEFVGEVEFRIDVDKKQVIHKSAICHEVQQYEPDPKLEKLIEQHRGIAREHLSEQVAYLLVPMTTSWHEESPLGNLLARGLRQWTGADLAIVNAGQILRNLDEGSITREIMLEACPSPINPCRITIKGASIRQAIEEATIENFIQLPIKGFGFRGKMLGTLCLDGIEVLIDTSHRVGILINGIPLQDEREYDLATIDMFTFGIGYLSLKEGRDVRYFLPEFIRDVLIHELQNPDAIKDSFRRRWNRV